MSSIPAKPVPVESESVMAPPFKHKVAATNVVVKTVMIDSGEDEHAMERAAIEVGGSKGLKPSHLFSADTTTIDDVTPCVSAVGAEKGDVTNSVAAASLDTTVGEGMEYMASTEEFILSGAAEIAPATGGRESVEGFGSIFDPRIDFIKREPVKAAIGECRSDSPGPVIVSPSGPAAISEDNTRSAFSTSLQTFFFGGSNKKEEPEDVAPVLATPTGQYAVPATLDEALAAQPLLQPGDEEAFPGGSEGAEAKGEGKQSKLSTLDEDKVQRAVERFPDEEKATEVAKELHGSSEMRATSVLTSLGTDISKERPMEVKMSPVEHGTLPCNPCPEQKTPSCAAEPFFGTSTVAGTPEDDIDEVSCHGENPTCDKTFLHNLSV